MRRANEGHSTTKETNDRKQRRQYYQIARARQRIGRSARFSRRPGRESIEWDTEEKETLARCLAHAKHTGVGNENTAQALHVSLKDAAPSAGLEHQEEAAKAAREAGDTRITREYASMQRKQADEKRKHDILTAERKRVELIEAMMEDMED